MYVYPLQDINVCIKVQIITEEKLTEVIYILAITLRIQRLFERYYLFLHSFI